jgi:phenylalanyl-tRNA synthetase beta chain
MKVSISWLSDYIPIEMDAPDLANALTMAGLEVESISDRYGYLDSVIVARVIAAAPHPNADKLKICQVDTGAETLSVVCGAPNVEENMLAPLALPGTIFPEGFILEKSVIRGQTSEGMLCSASELGLGIDKDGIMTLDPGLKVGEKLAGATAISDTIIELDLTPNRPDCLSILGIAREIAAIQKVQLKYPDYHLADDEDRISDFTSVTIEAPDHCPRYAARLLERIQVAPSPFWLQDKLLSVGLRPINNIVDITNFVLMETGQPLHAFDFDQLAGHRIVVRCAHEGEKFVTLDQKERVLSSEMLMICDGEKPVAVGGVMGGLNSEIEPDTTRVLIESAYFNPTSIRKTSKKLGLSTDASHRFERGIDPEGTIAAINRAAQLMIEIGGGKPIAGLIDEHPGPQRPKILSLSTRHTNRLLGTGLDRKEIGSLLASIEFKVTPQENDKDLLAVEPPSFRVDVARPEDLMEEVARLSGYNNIPTTFPMMPAEARPPVGQINLRNRLKDLMAGFGFREVITYSFMHHLSPDRLRLKPDDEGRSLVNILNPLNEDQAVMRTSIIPGLLQTVHHNFAQQIKDLKIFEIGKIFIRKGSGELPQEIEMLAGLWTGARRAASWHNRERLCDFYDIKGVVEGLLKALKIDKIRFTKLDDNLCNYVRSGYSARILADNLPLGVIGELNSRVLENFDLKQTAYIFQIEFDRLLPLAAKITSSKPMPKYPAIFRDITIHINKDIEAQAIIGAVRNVEQPLMENIDLIDVFEGDPIAAGRKSITLRVTYRSSSKTLEDEDVQDIHKSIAGKLVEAFDAALPG